MVVSVFSMPKCRLSTCRGVDFYGTATTKVEDILNRFGQYGVEPVVSDPWADAADARRSYGVELVPMEEMRDLDCLLVAVAHRQFREMGSGDFKAMFAEGPDDRKVVVDVKSILDKAEFADYRYWRL